MVDVALEVAVLLASGVAAGWLGIAGASTISMRVDVAVLPAASVMTGGAMFILRVISAGDAA